MPKDSLYEMSSPNFSSLCIIFSRSHSYFAKAVSSELPRGGDKIIVQFFDHKLSGWSDVGRNQVRLVGFERDFAFFCFGVP